MNQVIDNIEQLIAEHGERIKTNRHLLLLYWKIYDNVKLDGSVMSVSDFLENDNITDPRHIIEGKMMLDLLNKEG